MKTLLSLGAISMLLACSSGTTTTVPGPAPTDTGTPGPAATNPNGVAYPTANLGFTKNTRIPNLKFVGYQASGTSTMVSTSGATTTMSLADFYNPDGKNPGGYTIIHLSAAARWCGPCNMETSEISGYDYQTNMRTGPGVAADLAPKGVVFLQALVDGFTPGVPATTSDLQGWISDHQNNFNTMVDPEQVQLGPFFQGASIPWNADIDARSMQILDLMQGYSTTLEADISTWVDWQSTHPPMQ